MPTLDDVPLSMLACIQRMGQRLAADGFFPDVRISSDIAGRLSIMIGMEVRKKGSLASLLGPFTIIREPDVAGQLLRILALLETPDITVFSAPLGA